MKKRVKENYDNTNQNCTSYCTQYPNRCFDGKPTYTYSNDTSTTHTSTDSSWQHAGLNANNQPIYTKSTDCNENDSYYGYQNPNSLDWPLNTANKQRSNGINAVRLFGYVFIICVFGLGFLRAAWEPLRDNPNPDIDDMKAAIGLLIAGVLSILLPSLQLAG